MQFWIKLNQNEFDIRFANSLTQDENASFQKLNEHEGKEFASFLPSGFADGGKPTIVVKDNLPLMAVAYILVHEGTHLINRREKWYVDLNSQIMEVLKADNNGEDFRDYKDKFGNLSELVYGLQFTRTYLDEYTAFSGSSDIREGFEQKIPCLKSEWIKFKASHGVTLDLNPRSSLVDQVKLANAYVWPGNYTRLRAGVECVSRDALLSRQIIEAGVDLVQVQKALKVL